MLTFGNLLGKLTSGMKNESVNIKNLKTPQNFAIEKGISRQLVYRMIGEGKIDTVNIDGTVFILLNEKAKSYKRSR
ncbi:MAG: hypothetical protein V1720_14835 [bacterium]